MPDTAKDGVDLYIAARKEIERLRADYDRMWSALQAETATGVRVRGELRAEIERLRTALAAHHPPEFADTTGWFCSSDV